MNELESFDYICKYNQVGTLEGMPKNRLNQLTPS